MAEWLRRRPAKPLGFARVGSNPTGVVISFFEKKTRHKLKTKEVLPGFEPGLLDSKSRVITNYTIEPLLVVMIKINYIPDGIRTRNLKIRSLTPYPLGHGDTSF